MNIILNHQKYKVSSIILPLGHKMKYFKSYFDKQTKKYKINLLNKNKVTLKNKINLLLFNAGKNTSKNERILKSLRYINQDYFLTYGDGVAISIFLRLKINLKNSIQKR